MFVAGYSPSMSPPVKQGRDGEQDSTDGSVLHETDRSVYTYAGFGMVETLTPPHAHVYAKYTVRTGHTHL